MAGFHDKLVLNKYILSLFGVSGFEGLAQNLKLSSLEGYTEEGNTRYLYAIQTHLYHTDHITKEMLQEYDDNIVRFTRQISSGRDNLISWKYFQYLSLLFTEIYLDKYFQSRDNLCRELNSFIHDTFQPAAPPQSRGRARGRRNEEFIPELYHPDGLNKLAFWNATGSGKTLLMHVNIKQYLHYTAKYDQHHKHKVLLITPNEGLSKQHLDEFQLSDIPSVIFSKSSQGGLFASSEVEILEISKLSDTSGDKTVAVDSFETDNLVLIDEGHGGMGGTAWKAYRDQLSETGFAFEYSATFGQAIHAATGANKSGLEQEYAKSILFDYSYKFFYEDGYGKDYRILNLKEDHNEYTTKYLTANLLSYYQQLLLYRDKKNICAQFNIHKPLWVFVGGKVNAVRTVEKKEVSDVLEIIYFLTDFLKDIPNSISTIDSILKGTAGLVNQHGASLFEHSFTYLKELDLTPTVIFDEINHLVFNNHVKGANLYLDNLKGADGELGMRVGEADYFGVINVGDEGKLHNLATTNGVPGADKDFSSSLFKTINEDHSSINLLIGSKKFTEGWSSWRVSSMGLMNVGRSEGSQIIQLFGRGVRLRGYRGSLKRSKGLDEYQKPENIRDVKPYLKHLETLQIFGVRADYMEKFKDFLEEEGLPPNDSEWVSVYIPTVKKPAVSEERLKIIQVKEGENFKQKKRLALQLTESIFAGRSVELDWYPKIDVLVKTRDNTSGLKEPNYLGTSQLAFLNWNRIYLEIENYKAERGYSNLTIIPAALRDILNSRSWYTLYIPSSELQFKSFRQSRNWEELSIALLKKYIDRYYSYHRNQHNGENIISRYLSPDDENFINEHEVRVNIEEEETQYKTKLDQLKEQVLNVNFNEIKYGDQFVAFDNILHLYKPLFYLDGKQYVDKVSVHPIALDTAEKNFLDDLIKEVGDHRAKYEGLKFFVLRNQSQKGIGFFTEEGFYPDFILWIIRDDHQYITFIDPKGIRNCKTLSDSKIVFYKTLKEKMEHQVSAEGVRLNSFIISNTKFLDVHWKGNLTIDDFHKEHVYFQYEDHKTYIKDMVEHILQV